MRGAGSIATWPAQASDRARSVRLLGEPRDNLLSFYTGTRRPLVREVFFFVRFNMRLPGGVIGNTQGFDPCIPGSSPGRVTF